MPGKKGNMSMAHYVNYGNKKIDFSLPKGWNLISARIKLLLFQASTDPITRNQTCPGPSHWFTKDRRTGTPRNGCRFALFDDLSTSNTGSSGIPEILNRLNHAGIPDNRISGICSLGTHPIPPLEQLKKKVGEEVFSRLQGRISPHNPHASDNVIIGKTHRGTLVEINPRVAFSDLIIGVGECMPHPVAGFGGGCKIIMPGVCSYRSVASHHFTWMRHRNNKGKPTQWEFLL